MKKIMRDTPWGYKPYIEYRELMEFGKKEYDAIDKYCKDVGIPWFASPWDVASVDFLDQYDIPFIKVASALVTDLSLLETVRKTGKKVWINSTAGVFLT